MCEPRHCSEANVSLCLGTSLLITPSCNLPARTLRAGGSLAIVVRARVALRGCDDVTLHDTSALQNSLTGETCLLLFLVDKQVLT